MLSTISPEKGGPASNIMKAVSAGIMTVALATSAPAASGAEPTPQISSHDASSPGVPTTKLMAIGTRTTKGTPDAVKQLLPSEIRQTVQLYLTGKLDQWFVKQDQTGVIFILNVTDPNEAEALLGQLPLGRAGLMDFQLIPLGPLSPLGLLLSKTSD